MEKFTHYLVTRFNVPFSGHAPEFFSGTTLSADWLKQRIRLFADFCAPSVAGQSNLAFTWLIYLDPETERTDIIRIRAAIPSNLRVEFRYVADYALMLEDLRSYCKACGSDFVITSRLDNDDAIGKDYVQKVQLAFVAKDKVLLNFLGGIYYNPVRRLMTRHRHKLRNSFTSIIEEISPEKLPETIFGFPHLYPKQDIQVINLPYAHAFWINLHGGNEGDRTVRGWPVWSKAACDHYAFAPGHVRISVPATIAYLLRWAPVALVKKIRFRLTPKGHG